MNLEKDLRIIRRVISILIYHVVRDVFTCFPSVRTSPVKAPF